MKVVLVYL